MSNNNQPTDQERAEQVATDMERIAAFVRANPEVAENLGRQNFLVCLYREGDPRAAMAYYARRGLRAGATIDKNVSDKYASVLLRFGSFALDVYAEREQVCERVVTGTREIEVEEQDPEALAAVPTRTVTKVVEDVEWVCTPLLSGADK